jgi:hypothetical protein
LQGVHYQAGRGLSVGALFSKYYPIHLIRCFEGAAAANITAAVVASITADLIMSFAAEGETNPKGLKELALSALPRALEAS